MTADGDTLRVLAKRYREFALVEARGVSALYEALASFIADCPEILTFIAALPVDRQQPNLFLAAVRYIAGVQQSGDQLIQAVRGRADDIRRIMLSKTTQTNEPARCAVLLPLLALLPQPIALLEVGASAGLCLLPDRYGYDYGSTILEPKGGGHLPTPIFPCTVSAGTPLPTAVPTILWRAGLDVNPLDVRSQADRAWLETLVWPDQTDRAARLRAAMAIARSDPPRIVRGDLFSDLGPLLNEVPPEATAVVFHTAVLGYVRGQSRRDQFAEAMLASPAVWISNESPRVFPSMAKAAPEPVSPDQFLLSVNGTPVAWTGPHGQSLDWFGAIPLPD